MHSSIVASIDKILLLLILDVSFGDFSDLPESETQIVTNAIGTAASGTPGPALLVIPYDEELADLNSTTFCSVSYPYPMNISWANCTSDFCTKEEFALPKQQQPGEFSGYVDESKLLQNCTFLDGNSPLTSTDRNVLFLSEDLYHLDLGTNHVEEFPPGYFCHLTKLKNLYINRVEVRDSYKLGLLPVDKCNSYRKCCLCRMKNLNLMNNHLHRIKNGSFCGLVDLLKLNISSSEVEFIEEGAFTHLINLQMLDLAKNELKILQDGTFFDLTNLTVLNISHNKLENISAKSFSWFVNLQVLKLEYNNIRDLPEGVFDHLISVIIMDLSHNSLTALSSQIFRNQINLEYLDLSNNKLKFIGDHAFSTVASLRKIYLQHNELDYFPVWNLENLTELTSLSLHNNPWSCECDYVKRFRDFLQKFSMMLQNTKNLYCITSNFTEMPLINFDLAYCYVNGSLITTTTAIFSVYANIWGTLLAIVIFLTIVSILIFIYRQEMQVLIYSRYGVRLLASKRNEQDKMFDAFISYSNDDEQFLVRQLLPGLENIERPYSLCLHHRNFAVGAVISDSIIAAVQNSVLTLILLSDNFIRSEWCRLEFKAAHLQMMQDRCNRILVVVISEEIPTDLDAEMQLYMKTNTYLKWDDKLFWKKLYFALPEPTLSHPK